MNTAIEDSSSYGIDEDDKEIFELEQLASSLIIAFTPCIITNDLRLQKAVSTKNYWEFLGDKGQYLSRFETLWNKHWVDKNRAKAEIPKKIAKLVSSLQISSNSLTAKQCEIWRVVVRLRQLIEGG